MKIPLEVLIDRVEVSELRLADETVGFEANCFTPGRDTPSGGGFAESMDYAKLIAVAETIERFLIMECINDESLSARFALDKDCSSNGFAFHSEAQKSALNALCEAFERLVRYRVFLCDRPILARKQSTVWACDPVLERLAAEFLKIEWFEQVGTVLIGSQYSISLRCVICLCTVDGGMVFGATAHMADESDLEAMRHCLVEAWRNKRLALKRADSSDSLQLRRIRSGFENGIMVKSTENSFSVNLSDKLVLFETQYFASANGYLSRAQFEGPLWTDMPVDRIV